MWEVYIYSGKVTHHFVECESEKEQRKSAMHTDIPMLTRMLLNGAWTIERCMHEY